MAATVGWPSEEWGFNPGTYTELRPGCFDVHERVRDMNANGVLGSMCFPTMAGWNARTFAESRDKEIALVMLQAYNDWAIDEWCGAYPGRFIPLGIVPMWDVEAAVAEVRRIAKKGCRSISFLETPHVQGFPSFLSGYWDPMLAALSEENMVLSLHIGAGFAVIQRAEEAPVDHLMVLACQISAITAQDLLFGPTLRRFPDLKVALSEGGIGWIPFYFDRIDRHFQNQEWLHSDFGGKLPSEVFRDHILACYITDPSGLLLRDRIGLDNIAWECDYPHTDTTWPESPEFAWKEFQDAGCRDEEIHKITWENACRFYGWDPFAHTPKEQATVGALRALARDVDVTADVARGMAQAQRGGRHRRRRSRLTRKCHMTDARHTRRHATHNRGDHRSDGDQMPLGLSEDQEFFRETTERFLAEQVPPDALRALRDDPAGFDPAYWRRGAELGWTSLLVGEEHGGGTISGAGLVDLSLVAYEFGRHAAPGPLVATNVVAATLSAHGAAPDVLADLLSGRGDRHRGAPRSSRPTGGSRRVEAAPSGTDLVSARRGAARWSRRGRRVTCSSPAARRRVSPRCWCRRRRPASPWRRHADGRPHPPLRRRDLRRRHASRRRRGR